MARTTNKLKSNLIILGHLKDDRKKSNATKFFGSKNWKTSKVIHV